MRSQSTSRVLMIRPVRFVGNAQTADSNRFQQLNETLAAQAVQQAACDEFDGLVAALQNAGVHVHVLEDTPEPHTPDSIFPNNWFSTHVEGVAEGTLVLYPMCAPNRRLERRADVVDVLRQMGARLQRTLDLSVHEARGEFLEGTGSLVLDRVNQVAYACRSPRTHEHVLHAFVQQLGYDCEVFDAHDQDNVPVYHTNVLMSVGTRFAVVCMAAIPPAQRERLSARLQRSGHELIEISLPQMHSFAGNILELRTAQDETCVAMSHSAFAAFTPKQRERLQQLGGPLIVAPIPTIERLGGGSVRCMLAEVFA